jgi:hypothetical protein
MDLYYTESQTTGLGIALMADGETEREKIERACREADDKPFYQQAVEELKERRFSLREDGTWVHENGKTRVSDDAIRGLGALWGSVALDELFSDFPPPKSAVDKLAELAEEDD